MDRLIELGQLFAYYGACLTERQRSLVGAYANEDLSLGELAEREHISRQGARDVIVRAEQQLRDMERQLGLIRRHTRLSAQLDRLSDLARALPKDTVQRQPLLEGLDEAYRILEDDDGV